MEASASQRDRLRDVGWGLGICAFDVDWPSDAAQTFRRSRKECKYHRGCMELDFDLSRIARRWSNEIVREQRTHVVCEGNYTPRYLGFTVRLLLENIVSTAVAIEGGPGDYPRAQMHEGNLDAGWRAARRPTTHPRRRRRKRGGRSTAQYGYGRLNAFMSLYDLENLVEARFLTRGGDSEAGA
jgi:hypothetical protein